MQFLTTREQGIGSLQESNKVFVILKGYVSVAHSCRYAKAICRGESLSRRYSTSRDAAFVVYKRKGNVMEQAMIRVARLLAAFLVGCVLCGLMTLLTGCRSVRYVSVPEYHTEYKVRTDSFIKRDSVWVHDSVSVWMKGDTVFKDKVRTKHEDHYIYTNKTDTVMKTDSVRVPFPVEKKLGRWEQIKVDYFVPICCVLAIILLSLLWLIKRRF